MVWGGGWGMRVFGRGGGGSVEREPGLWVVTGETGAGKSILVDAIELLVGARAEAGVVREGCERAELSAEFDFENDSPAASWVVANELNGNPGQLILRRTIDRSGRTRCFINGHSATLAQLKELGELLVDIHGQHAHQSLLRGPAQRDLVDTHAEATGLARETAEALRDWKRLERLAQEAQKSVPPR